MKGSTSSIFQFVKVSFYETNYGFSSLPGCYSTLILYAISLLFISVVFIFTFMELRSGRICHAMNPVNEKVISEAVASLIELYKKADILMTDMSNVNDIQSFLPDVNSAYDRLVSLCSNLNDNDPIPSTSLSKLDVDAGYWGFKAKVQHWLDKASSSNVDSGQYRRDARSPVSSGQMVSSRNQPAVSMPSIGQTEGMVHSSAKATLQARNPPGLLLSPPAGVSPGSSHDVPPGISSDVQLPDVSPPCFEKDVLPYQSRSYKKSHRSSKSSKGSKTSTTATSASRLEEAKIKLELARLTKMQNLERLREEEEIQRVKADMERQKAEMEEQMKRQQAEMKRQQTELEEEMKRRQEKLKNRQEEMQTKWQREKLAAEDERRIEAARLETTLRRAEGQYDDLSSTHSLNVGVAQRSSLHTFDLAVGKQRSQMSAFNKSSREAHPNPSRLGLGHLYTETQCPRLHTGNQQVSRPTVRVNSHQARDIGMEVPDRIPAAQVYESDRWERPEYTSPRTYNRYLDPDRLLPKPSIKLFEGDPLDYWAFYNRFRGHIGDWLSPKRQLSYLLQHCSAEVANNIQHYADLHDDQYAYELAWQELKYRYGQPHIIAQACEERLTSFPKLDKDTADRLNKLSVLMKRCCHALADDRVASSLDSVPFLTAIASKFPLDLKRKWVDTAVKITEESGRNASFKDLALFVETQAKVSNSTFGLKLFGPSLSQSDPFKKTKAVTFQTTTKSESEVEKSLPKPKCHCCSEMHKLYQCSKFRELPLSDRSQLVKKHKLCKRCLNPGHHAKSCTLNIKCKRKNCDKRDDHNSLLHTPYSLSKESSSDSKSGNSAPDPDPSAKLVETKTLALSSRTSGITTSSRAYLDIVPVKVKSNDHVVYTYALLDTGSDRTFCEQCLAKRLDLESSVPAKLAVQTLSPGNPYVLNTIAVSFSICSLNDDYAMNLSEVVVVDNIPVAPSVAPSSESIQKHSHLCDVSLTEIEGGSVTLLIGSDYAAAHRCIESRFSPDPDLSPDAVLTPFGWMLRGTSLAGDNDIFSQETSTNLLVRGYQWPPDLHDLESLIVTDEGEFFSTSPTPEISDMEDILKLLKQHKEIGELGCKYALEDPIAYDIMSRNLQYEDGHYQLPLLWRNAAASLPHSRKMALRRLDSLKKRLSKDQTLHQRYTMQMEKTIEMGHAEQIPVTETSPSCGLKEWYIPHHPVLNPKKPDKVRIVYDCAASADGKSLNDFLMKGPDLMNSLVGVLLRFRREKIPIIADIESMFYQIRVPSSDRGALRFFWWPLGSLNAEPSVYQMTVHLFGAKSSPSCASFCLRQTAKEFGRHFDPFISEIVHKNFYVDDCLVSVKNEKTAIEVVQQLSALLLKGGFKLRKWMSTNDVVMQHISEEDRAKSPLNAMPSTTLRNCVLGVDWCVATDEFFFKISIPTSCATKRNILSITNSLYDPLGFVLPVVLRARLVYSEICKAKLDWDEALTGANLKQWESWIQSLVGLENIRVPRCFKEISHEPIQLQLHFFSDASNVARGAVCYARIIGQDSKIICRLIMAKCHVTGSGQHTIPRLELEAALDAVKLSNTIKRELEIPDAPCLFWTDSTIVLQSLRADVKKFSLYPRNRLQRILQHSKVHDWNFVGTKLNPADKLTRGLSAKSLAKDLMWYEGPPFLKHPPDKWPILPSKSSSPELPRKFDLEKNLVFTTASSTNETSSFRPNTQSPMMTLIDSFSSLNRLTLSIAWLARFKLYLHRQMTGTNLPPQQPISVAELEKSELDLIQYVQRNNFVHEMSCIERNQQIPRKSCLYRLDPIMADGLLRVGGRLDNASLAFDLKHPIILPESGQFTFLIINHVHSKVVGHCGINTTLNSLCQRFWVINAKAAVRRVVNSCVTCKKCNARSERQYMADLPLARFQIHEPPFTHVGVDYFGPLMA